MEKGKLIKRVIVSREHKFFTEMKRKRNKKYIILFSILSIIGIAGLILGFVSSTDDIIVAGGVLGGVGLIGLIIYLSIILISKNIKGENVYDFYDNAMETYVLNKNKKKFSHKYLYKVSINHYISKVYFTNDSITIFIHYGNSGLIEMGRKILIPNEILGNDLDSFKDFFVSKGIEIY